MHLNMTYPCGCALSRMRENEPFVLVAACIEHQGDESLSSHAVLGESARGAAPEHTRLPAFKIVDAIGMALNSDGKTYRVDGTADPTLAKADIAAQAARDLGIAPMAAISPPDLSEFAKPVTQRVTPEQICDALHERDAEWATNLMEVFGSIGIRVRECGHNPHDHAYFKAWAQLIVDKAWDLKPGKANQERDSEWRNCMRSALSDVDHALGTNVSQRVEFPTSGPSVFAMKGVFHGLFHVAREDARKVDGFTKDERSVILLLAVCRQFDLITELRPLEQMQAKHGGYSPVLSKRIHAAKDELALIEPLLKKLRP